MLKIPYLMSLAVRLSGGLESLEAERRERHRAFILTRQKGDGGFAGREGDSDLYYTSFAVRALTLLNAFESDDAERVNGFLQETFSRQVSVIDLVSWLYTALVVVGTGAAKSPLDPMGEGWEDRLADLLESFRRPDGGYAKASEGAAGSTYHSFLVALCYELIGRDLPQPKRLVQFVYDRQRDDGGFVEIAPMKRSGTNPTAAAVALLTMFDAMDDDIRRDVGEFLTSVRSAEGGFQANSRVPFADTLSTFTGLLTAQDLELEGILDPEQAQRFVCALELPTGGFRAASWDQQADVEYTFYALGILGLLKNGFSHQARTSS